MAPELNPVPFGRCRGRWRERRHRTVPTGSAKARDGFSLSSTFVTAGVATSLSQSVSVVPLEDHQVDVTVKAAGGAQTLFFLSLARSVAVWRGTI